MTFSPLIQNGKLSLTPSGDLASAPDIITQMTVGITAYHCIFDPTINSQLLPYLNTIPIGGYNSNAITNIVVNAYKPMITAGIIVDLQIAVLNPELLSTLTINVSVTDNKGNVSSLSWNNQQQIYISPI